MRSHPEPSGEWLLAYVKPLTGIFTVDSAYFFHLQIYEGITIPPPGPTRVIEIPTDVHAGDEVISLDEVFDMKAMWPQHTEQTESGGSRHTFVDM